MVRFASAFGAAFLMDGDGTTSVGTCSFPHGPAPFGSLLLLPLRFVLMRNKTRVEPYVPKGPPPHEPFFRASSLPRATKMLRNPTALAPSRVRERASFETEREPARKNPRGWMDCTTPSPSCCVFVLRYFIGGMNNKKRNTNPHFFFFPGRSSLCGHRRECRSRFFFFHNWTESIQSVAFAG